MGRLAQADLNERVALVVTTVQSRRDGTIAMDEPPRDPVYQRPYSGFYWQIEGPRNTLRSRSLWDLSLPPAPQDAGRQ